ncbi:MAG: hypothetical protein M1820_005416 [Bogoriella megaspora]|nr:MAG: hypothetical protein M1820_005416 [Bogoriella megaspora]
MARLVVTVPLLAGLPTALAWGELGHYTVGYIAQNFVASSTASWAKDILASGSSNTSYLASVATWADSYRYTSAGSFSAPFHYIDAEDKPPSSCSVDYDRDCGEAGCSISAIANYTTRVQDGRRSVSDRQASLKFLVHIIGDLHQPLHDEALEVGGNDIDVKFGSESTNLHHIWDTEIPEKLVGGYALSDAQSWASTLTTAIKSGQYKSQAASWVSGIDLSDPVTTTLKWASEANADVCTVVLPQGQSYYVNKDLSTTYYNGAIDTVELQIARAGYRLAKWLDLIAANDSKRKRSIEEGTTPEPLLDVQEPPKPARLSRAKMARMARGYNCNHKH